jgi:serine/threonine protein kinase
MEYASDGDLFGQILNSCRYLGNDDLIKHVFLQLLGAVEYCHSLGIYHRDLKPKDVVCFDNGLRIAITDSFPDGLRFLGPSAMTHVQSSPET